jgi:hypothetical protein
MRFRTLPAFEKYLLLTVSVKSRHYGRRFSPTYLLFQAGIFALPPGPIRLPELFCVSAESTGMRHIDSPLPYLFDGPGPGLLKDASWVKLKLPEPPGLTRQFLASDSCEGLASLDGHLAPVWSLTSQSGIRRVPYRPSTAWYRSSEQSTASTQNSLPVLYVGDVG